MADEATRRPQSVQTREDYGAPAPPANRTHGSSEHSPGYLEQEHPRVSRTEVTRRRRAVVLPPRSKPAPERSS